MKKKIISLAILTTMLLILSSCTTTQNIEPTYVTRTCSICAGKGYYTVEDQSNWPHIMYITSLCVYCNGKGHVSELYYYDNDRAIQYNYPYRHYRYKPMPRKRIKRHSIKTKHRKIR